MFTETDSLVYEIETEDVDEDFYGDKNLFWIHEIQRFLTLLIKE